MLIIHIWDFNKSYRSPWYQTIDIQIAHWNFWIIVVVVRIVRVYKGYIVGNIASAFFCLTAQNMAQHHGIPPGIILRFSPYNVFFIVLAFRCHTSSGQVGRIWLRCLLLYRAQGLGFIHIGRIDIFLGVWWWFPRRHMLLPRLFPFLSVVNENFFIWMYISQCHYF